MYENRRGGHRRGPGRRRGRRRCRRCRHRRRRPLWRAVRGELERSLQRERSAFDQSQAHIWRSCLFRQPPN